MDGKIVCECRHCKTQDIAYTLEEFLGHIKAVEKAGELPQAYDSEGNKLPQSGLKDDSVE